MQSRRNLFGINIANVRPLRSLCALSLAGVMATMATQGAGAQSTDIQPVVGVHSGTCADYVPEPAYDFGVMTSIPVQGVAEESEGRAEGVDEGEGDLFGDDQLVGAFGDDQEFAEDDEGYLSDDLDGDGIFEIGFDQNADGTLTDDEVLGEDDNGDGVLGFNELWSPFPIQTVWKADAADLEVDGAELVTECPHVMLVHANAEDYDRILACGPILDLVEEDFVVVPLQPYSNSGYFGNALIQKDSGEYAAYLFSGISAGGQSGEDNPGAGGVTTSAVLGEDGVFNQEDEGYLSEDLDGDGIFEIGMDENGDGILDENEVLGEDVNDDGELTEDELSV
jgi:hypothetical protein